MSSDSNTLRIPLRGGRAAFVLFAVVHVAIAVYGAGGYRSAPFGFVALALVLAAGFLVTGGTAPRLGVRRAVVVAVLCVLASASVWNLPTHGWPGWSSWIWGAVTFVAFALTLRGRTALAWWSFLGMTLLTVWWCVDVGRGAVAGVGFVIRSAALLFVVSLFALLLARTRAAIVRVQLVARDRARAQAAASAALDEQNDRMHALRTSAVPALTRIASDALLTDADRRAFELLEGALRDRIRAGWLVAPRVAEATRGARERGAIVSLLNDRGAEGLAEPDWARVEAEVVGALDAADGGSVTVRLLPAGRAVLATIVSDNAGVVTRRSVEPQDEAADRYVSGGP